MDCLWIPTYLNKKVGQAKECPTKQDNVNIVTGLLIQI